MAKIRKSIPVGVRYYNGQAEVVERFYEVVGRRAVTQTLFKLMEWYLKQYDKAQAKGGEKHEVITESEQD